MSVRRHGAFLLMALAIACDDAEVTTDAALDVDAAMLDDAPEAIDADAVADGSEALDAIVAADADIQADATPLACSNDTGSVDGTIAGEAIDPIASTWYRALSPSYHVIILDEKPTQCGFTAGSGEHVGLAFCAAPVPGQYQMATQSFPTMPCPGEMIAISFVEDGGGGDLAVSVSGTVTIAAADDCISGSFDITYDTGDTLTGSFSAAVCPP